MKLEQITNHTFKQKQSTFNRFLTGVSKRLFYVAVTRAKEEVIIYTRKSTQSKFITEIKDFVKREELSY